MTIDYSTPGKVIFRMDNYVDGIVSEAKDDKFMNGTSPDPASEHLFDTSDNDAVPLNSESVEYFHTMVAKLLFVSKWARPEIQQAVAFLTTRIKSPNEHDYKKLSRVIRYLRGNQPTSPFDARSRREPRCEVVDRCVFRCAL
ncbi:hypothetical protein SEMRO_2342_G324130.1 [Seminavis robusta]|uniref:Reverse transcriptase n=1 Tax=Seminavis robusta TaxID=568900 RepID=A0A9N8EZP3_9STRA|nr:hypothetical protein SEMRO_2342_G324130.1 [Seminavis robusta]|eukprot:Sro2342_g324130.1 n/a (142) ;mRNA; f:10150-10575